jgi:N-acetyl-gamma-glutamyl-phosphate reductase
MTKPYSVGIVGARGHTGSELLRLLSAHPDVEVTYAGSRELAGEPVPSMEGLVFQSLDADGVAALELDAVFLALPNGVSKPFVEALSDQTTVVDISADHRFDDAWVYGLPELNRDKIAGAKRIANPGCYATVAQLTVAPFLEVVEGVPTVFGVSGYSGAGTTPSPKNDPERLADSLIPYSLTGHIHEREASRNLNLPVALMPHVHPTFRGLLVTTHIPTRSSIQRDEASVRLREAYEGEALVTVEEQVPELRDGTGINGVIIGGLDVDEDGRRIVVVGVEDNLLKGAAVQAIQNLNLGLGVPEFTALV